MMYKNSTLIHKKKTPSKPRQRKEFLNLIKIKKYIATIRVNGKILKAFSSNGDFSSILETLVNSEKQREKKVVRTGKNKIKP